MVVWPPYAQEMSASDNLGQMITASCDADGVTDLLVKLAICSVLWVSRGFQVQPGGCKTHIDDYGHFDFWVRDEIQPTEDVERANN